MITITFPDGNTKQYEAGITALDVAKSISEGLARNVLSANVNGVVVDATRPINEDANILFFTWKDTEGKSTCGTLPLTFLQKRWNHFIRE